MDEPSAKPPIHVSAFTCQTVIKEQQADKDLGAMLTAVRIADAFTVVPHVTTLMIGGRPVALRNYPDLQFHLFIMMRGDPRKFIATIKGIRPNGEVQDLHSFECETIGGVGGKSALLLNIKMPGDRHGQHWIEIYVDEELGLRLPVMVWDGTSRNQTPEPQQPNEPSEVPPRQES